MHFQNPNWKPYKSLFFNQEKGFLFAGEGVTKQGEIHVFKFSQNPDTQQFTQIEQVMVLKGHKYGIKQIIAKGDLVVSIGDENDKGIILWEVLTPRILSANLIKNSQINGAIFLSYDTAQNEQIQFLTYGSNGHIKIWTAEKLKDKIMTIYTVENFSNQQGVSNVPKLNGLKVNFLKNQENYEFTKIILKDSKIAILGFTKDSDNFQRFSMFNYDLKNGKLLNQFDLPLQDASFLMTIDSSNENLIINQAQSRLQSYEFDSLKLSLLNDTKLNSINNKYPDFVILFQNNILRATLRISY